MKFSSRSFVPILVVCGAVIGGVLTYLVLTSWYGYVNMPMVQGSSSVHQERLENQDRQKEGVTTDESGTPVYHFSTTTLDAVWNTPHELSRSEMKDLLLRVTTDTQAVDGFIHQPRINGFFDGSENYPTVSETIVRMWRVGVISSSPYEGNEVYLLKTAPTDGPNWPSYSVFVFNPSSGELYSPFEAGDVTWYPSVSSGLIAGYSTPRSMHFSSLMMPRELILNNGKKIIGSESIVIDRTSGTRMELNGSLIPFGKTQEGIEMYRSKNDQSRGCIFVFDAIGRVYAYSSVITSDVVWSEDLKDAGRDQYTEFLNTGCGVSPCVSISKTGPDMNLVRVGGSTDDGEDVYIMKDYASDEATKQLHDIWYSFNAEKESVEGMLKKHPIPYYYWKDAFGRWVVYQNSSLIPQAECGKPVIYLYPETQTDVRVALPKFINVTVSDPVYPKKGWSVTAKPNGDLISKADGKTYGSLYWEGTGVGYQPPTTGFVVSKYSVTTTLMSLLTKYGLNQKESFEFMNFWIPKFAETNALYFRVSFLTNEWSKAAPLSVTPVPKTSIRIFMDWQPLSAPISIAEPQIITPQRNGFTLVEWGGTLYK